MKKNKEVGDTSDVEKPTAPTQKVINMKAIKMVDSHSASNACSSTFNLDAPDNYPPYRYRFQSKQFYESLSNYDCSDAANECAWSGLTGMYIDNDHRMEQKQYYKRMLPLKSRGVALYHHMFQFSPYGSIQNYHIRQLQFDFLFCSLNVSCQLDRFNICGLLFLN